MSNDDKVLITGSGMAVFTDTQFSKPMCLNMAEGMFVGSQFDRGIEIGDEATDIQFIGCVIRDQRQPIEEMPKVKFTRCCIVYEGATTDSEPRTLSHDTWLYGEPPA